jgi:outer membrane protein OmpA-like peptidoglycan-associated protein
MNTKKCFQVIISVLIFCCFTAQGMAADEEKDFGDRVPDKDEFVNALVPDESETGVPEGYKGRAIRPQARTETASSQKSGGKAVSMEINFEKNSYRLSRRATQILDVVGTSLNDDRLKNFLFTIEGHTDASGNAGYNMKLSEKRARAVKDYLVTRYNVEPSRLKALGKGEEELLLENDPYAPKNRRVKIINSGTTRGLTR